MKTVYINKIPDNAVQIYNAKEYVDTNGNIYGIENRSNNLNVGKPYKKVLNNSNGYKYVKINYNDGRNISKRVHRLVAEAFIPNPDNLPIVMHINNKKNDNRVENLKWGTIQENTQQAVDDKLMVNDYGFNDSQSIQCECYDTLTNDHVETFGSISEASEYTGVSKGGILYQLKNPDSPIRKKLYFTLLNEGPKEHDIIVKCNIETDEILDKYINIGKASKENNISDSTISHQVNAGKPNWTKNNIYFKKIKI